MTLVHQVGAVGSLHLVGRGMFSGGHVSLALCVDARHFVGRGNF